MKALVLSVLIVGVLLPRDLPAQRGGTRGGGGLMQPAFSGRGGQGWRNGTQTNGAWRGRGWNNRNNGFGFGNPYGWGFGGWGYSDPYSDLGWPADSGEANQAAPVYLVMPPQMAEPVPPPPPPEPARPVLQNYAWPDNAGTPGAAFSLVSRDGTVRQALAVWVQDNQVRFTTSSGSSAALPAAAVDCTTTELMNQRNNLHLSLPGCKR